MPSISGNLSHSGSFGAIGSLTPIPHIPICLYNTNSLSGIYVLTDTNGNFTFNNVPSGTYTLVEVGQGTTTNTSPIDFTNATLITPPLGSDPSFSSILTPISNTNTVESLTPNTLFLTVNTSNLTNQNFIDSTILCKPLSIPNGVTLSSNVLTKAGNGIFGTLPAGTFADTRPSSYPYSNSMTTGFTYIPTGGIGGVNQFTMVNINKTNWFMLANHTTFDETSSMLAVNGGDPNVILFFETANVLPNTYYLASAWLNMITNYPNTCLIGFKVLASDGVTQLFYGQTSNIEYGIWGEIGQIFNSGNNSKVTVQVLTMSTVAGGNDFVLDDIFLGIVNVNNVVTINKSVDKSIASIKDTLIYTSVINTNSNISNLYFIDTIPVGTTFNQGTVNVNGVNHSTYNPQTGFSINGLPANSTLTIDFSVTVTSIPPSQTIVNNSSLNYEINIIQGNPISKTILSNTVVTNIVVISIVTYKIVDKLYADKGDTITYTILVHSNSNIPLTNLIFKDTIPIDTTFIPNSFTINNSPSQSNPETGINIGTLNPNKTTTLTFQVLINT